MKRRHRYQLLLNDTSRLSTVWQFRLTPLRTLFLVLMVMVVAVCISLAIIMFTPLKTLLPGYMKEGQRTDAISIMMKVDSLQTVYDRNQAYLDNLFKIMDTDREVGDSSKMAKPELGIQDTLMVAGAKERAFVREMEQREKYNISISAPLAADAMIFIMPASGAIISADTYDSKTARVIIPRGQGIDAISDGTVLDKYYDLKTRTYAIMIQHGKGFVSHYSHLGQPMVDTGDQVVAGQQIALQAPGDVKNSETIYLQIWHHGMQLKPSDYVHSYKYTAEEK